MTDETKSRYAGAKPYEPEETRLPYPVFAVLARDETYTRLAEFRWITNKLLDHIDSDDGVPDDVADTIANAAESFITPSAAMDFYVAEWIRTHAKPLVDDWGIDPGIVAPAADEYGVITLIDDDRVADAHTSAEGVA